MVGSKKIFILEDDVVVLTSLEKLLISSGFEVQGSLDGKNIISLIKVFRPDLILLDLLMPDMGGLEVCAMLNADKEIQGIPVLIVSALAKLADKKKAFELGVVGYIAKPYEFSYLLGEIEKAISLKETR